MSQTRTVLILQSDRAAIFPLASALRQSGWAVLSAEDAAFAMSIARRHKPDAVILNAQLAGGGGVVALKRLRSSMFTTQIPVICIVASNSGERSQLEAAGAQEMIEPPGDPQTISAALQRYLSQPETSTQVPPAILGSPEREEAIRKSGLRDSPPNEAFDRLMRLTTVLLDVPMALASVVDKDGQLVKSQIGLGLPFAAERTIPLSHSVCQWVVAGNEEIVIDDAREHPVLRTNPFVRDRQVTAYAGVPFSADQKSIGSFCAADSKRRSWTEDQVAILRDLSIVLQSYVTVGTESQDRQSKMTAVANGILAATRVLLRPECGDAERLELARIIEEEGHVLVRQVS